MKCEKIFAERRSNRTLSNKTLAKEEVDAILEAGELAPVARGKYDTLKLYVYQGEFLEMIKDSYIKELGADPFFGGGLLVLVTQKDEKECLMNQNAGCILENMLLEATKLNIGSVFLYSPVRVALTRTNLLELFEIDEGYMPIACGIFGYIKEKNVRNIEHKIDKVFRY